MKIIVTGENNNCYQDGLTLSEVARFVAAAEAAGISRTREATVEVYPTTARTTRKGKLKRFRGFAGRQSDVKKAIVTLADGQSIDVSTGL